MSAIQSIDLFIPTKFKTNIKLKPEEMNIDFEQLIFKKLKNKYEGICSKYGYIKKDSIKIMKRSVGNIIKQHFNGSICFELSCIAEICNPCKGTIVEAKVKAKNSLGILAETFNQNIVILEIIIPKISAGILSEVDINKIDIGENILVEICGIKSELFQKNISIIGRVIKNPNNIKKITKNIEDKELSDTEEQEELEELEELDLEDESDIDPDNEADIDVDNESVKQDKEISLKTKVGGNSTIIDDDESEDTSNTTDDDEEDEETISLNEGELESETEENPEDIDEY